MNRVNLIIETVKPLFTARVYQQRPALRKEGYALLLFESHSGSD